MSVFFLLDCRTFVLFYFILAADLIHINLHIIYNTIAKYLYIADKHHYPILLLFTASGV